MANYGKLLFWGLTAGTAYDTYRSQREKGRNAATATAVSLGTAYMWNAFQWPLMGLQLAQLIPMAQQGAFSATANLQRRAMPLSGFGTTDSAEAQTSRARGILAIQDSRLNARSYLGSEAGLFAARYH